MPRLLLILILVLCSRLNAQANIRQVDFKNLTYPLSGHLLGHNSLEWLSTAAKPDTKTKTIHIVRGSQLTKASSIVLNGKEYSHYEGFRLQSVRYVDLTGDGHEEAIIVLSWESGGTQTTHYVYVYTLGENGPRLLAYCHTGSRAELGLYHVYAKRGLLVFELLDPAREVGDCCSSGVLIYRYMWKDGIFKLASPIERRTLPPPHEEPIR